MTDEEYLRACGWNNVGGVGVLARWVPPRSATMRYLSLDEALERQLAADRARCNFVRDRSTMCGGLMAPAPEPEQGPAAAPDGGPADDLAAVAARIDKRLNDLYFHETAKASDLGIWKPGAWADEYGVNVTYGLPHVQYHLAERVARAYDRWLAAGNVGKHFEGDALRPEIAALEKRR